MNNVIVLTVWQLLLIVAGPAVVELITKIIWTLWKHYVKPKMSKPTITYNEILRVKENGAVREIKTPIK